MLPDIGILGPYTYLATIVFWGTIAIVLLWRADALDRAAVSIALLYPIGYVWDWYSLEVGIFDIVLRTGIDILGIPLEEHLFIVVVPALVIAVHELVHGPIHADTSARTERDVEAP